MEQANLMTQTQPIEVWLSQKNIEILGRIVFENETDYEYQVDALSMRGAQRELTSWLLHKGYKPSGRWEFETQVDGDGVTTVPECSRKFVREEVPDWILRNPAYSGS